MQGQIQCQGTERKRFLRDSFDDTGTLVFANGIVGAGLEVFELVKQHGFEGMVAKRWPHRIARAARASGSRSSILATAEKRRWGLG
jgi:ATP-dependent DNA ligase